MMNLTAIPASFLIPCLSDRTGRRSPFLLGLSLLLHHRRGRCSSLRPGSRTSAALLAGVAQGGLFALVMTLPLDFERTPARVGALVAMMLGLGYTIARDVAVRPRRDPRRDGLVRRRALGRGRRS